MWELDCEESWASKNWYFWTVVLEKTLESPLDCKEIQPVHSEGDQSWVFFGRIDAKAETPILQPPNAKTWLIGKDSDAGRDWGQEEKGMTEDEMAGWHHWLDGQEFGWTPGVGDGQGGLACCDSWGHKELDTTEWLNWTELNFHSYPAFTYCYALLYFLCTYTKPQGWPGACSWSGLLLSLCMHAASSWKLAPTKATTLRWKSHWPSLLLPLRLSLHQQHCWVFLITILCPHWPEQRRCWSWLS